MHCQGCVQHSQSWENAQQLEVGMLSFKFPIPLSSSP